MRSNCSTASRATGRRGSRTRATGTSRIFRSCTEFVGTHQIKCGRECGFRVSPGSDNPCTLILSFMRWLPRASIEERLRVGRGLRKRVPRTSHAPWKASDNRPDPIRLLTESDAGRIPDLLAIRYGRMQQSPFAFMRGAAAVMAYDLSQTPRVGVRVQACGDCHIMNFGAFASPERNLIFDINDFDETLPAPWEWDVKRLTASIEVAGRTAGTGSGSRENAVRAAVRSYREHLAQYATMASLELWYQQIDFQELVDRVPKPGNRKRDRKAAEKAQRKTVPIALLPLTAGENAEI